MNRPSLSAQQIAAISALIAAAALLVRLTAPPPSLVDQCLNSTNSTSSAPLVVVGFLSADSLVRGSVPMHSAPETPLQFRRLTIRVENVLKGGPLPAVISVYYFTWAGGYNGPRPLGSWRVGGRRICWLRPDSGVLRTVCDGWDGCTMSVQSGAHPGYAPDPAKPLDYALTDLLLTRGQGPIDNIAFASQISQGVPDQGLQEYVVEKLRRLALSERGEVKRAACWLLWIYTVDPTGAGIRRAAGDALHEAGCQCSLKPDGNLECR